MPQATATEALIVALVLFLVEAFFLHLAARLVTKNPRYLQAVLVAVFGALLSALLLAAVPNHVLGLFLAVLAWLLVAGFVYRIGLLRALALGVLAGLLFLVTQFLILLAVRFLTSN